MSEVTSTQACYSCSECKDYERNQWRNQCVNCSCPANEHRDFGAVEITKIKQILQIIDTQPKSSKYVWSPPGLNDEEIEQYMAALLEENRPIIGSKAAVDICFQLCKQLPPADFLLEQNLCIRTPTETMAYKQFTKDRDRNACSVGNVDTVQRESTCAACKKEIAPGSLAVFSDVTDLTWHPDCFRCDECDELLAELIHCYDDGAVFCPRHFAELDYQRCNGCDQLIFESEYTKSKGHYYHMEHYNCSQCSNPLTGKRYVLRQDQPTCLPCYEEKFANKCEKCDKAIGTDFKDLSYKGRHWHEACFLCWGCQSSLANQQFVAKDNGLYCPDCYDSSFAQRCDKCGNTFKHGMQKFEYNGKKFHYECFTCAECNQSIGNNSFVPKDEGKLVCMPCYNDKFAQKCGKCSEVLLQGGVTFRDLAYHRECFLCTGCDTELANVKFATKEEQPYCPDCYIKTFAKICEKCSQPIAGLGQATKYVAFEGRQWHADCFMCAQCEKSLLGQGFLVCNNLVVCPDCGKNM